MSAVPLGPHDLMVSIRGQLPCRGVSASGISVVARSFQPALRGDFVHIVDIPSSVRFSVLCFPVPVGVVAFTQVVCVKLHVMNKL